jgi:ADP-heptose:LPS heptosyltransferase
VSRIIVLRALPGLGDLLCAVPALRALRALRSHDVTLVGLPATRALTERFGAYVDRHVDFPGWPGLPEVPPDRPRIDAFLAEQRAERFDLALQLHGSGVSSAAFVTALGAARTGGFVPPGAPLPGDGWLEWVEDEPEPRRLLRLLAHLGLAEAGAHEALEFPVSAEEERAAADLGLPQPYACLHAGSSLPDRRWPAERFAAAADALHDRGLHPVLTGTAGEAGAVAAVAAAMRAPHTSLAGRTSVGVMACVLRDAAITITNDTGTSHLAAAVHAPSVIVHTVTDPARWAPLDRTRHRPLRGDVPVEAVLAEAATLLEPSERCLAPS